jgi:hypothetical protein
VTTERFLRPRDGLVWRQLGDALVLLDGISGRYFCLEGSAPKIWQILDRQHDVNAVVCALQAEYDGAGQLQRDVDAFVTSALEGELLTSGAQPGLSTPPEVTNAPVIQIQPSGLVLRGSLDPLRDEFARNHHVRLPNFVEPRLLGLVLHHVEQGRFVDRSHGRIGTEECLLPGTATGILQLVFNDSSLLRVISAIADCGELRCFDGRVYRMTPGAGHYDSWHSDAGKDRRIGISVNLSREPYEGGCLEIRPASETEATQAVANPGLGDAVMFRISPDLRHRVTSIAGSRPRTAYAGWFCSKPDFETLFLTSLPRG